MKKLHLLIIAAIISAVSGLQAAFTEDFDTFSLGLLAAQESWEAHATVTVETTATSGEYVGGRALRGNLAGDEWPRNDATGVALGLTLDQDGIEYGFDIREDNTSAVSVNMFMRQGRTANYGPAVGFSSGNFMIRPGATAGDTYTGTSLTSASTAGLWAKGDWLRIRLILSGTNFSVASIYCYNLTKGVDIPTGLVLFETGVNMLSKASTWTGFNFRISNNGTYVDNSYIEDYTAYVPPAAGLFTQNFDAFTLGTLTAQDSWEANANITVETTTDSGLYVGGRALKSTTYTDKTTRHIDAGVVFGLSPATFDGVEYGFDVREDITTVANVRMYLRQGATANYMPSFGLLSGVVAIRTVGEGGTTINGNNFSAAPYYGAEGTGYWVKGEWLRFKLILTGPDFDYATVLAYNLTRGGIEIPTGLLNVKLNVNPITKVSSMNRMNVRGGSTTTYIDNLYVTDYVNESVQAMLPQPADQAYPVEIDGGVTLSWVGAPLADSHKVYFGTSIDTLALQTDTTDEFYALPFALEKGVTYYWRVDEVIAGVDNAGLVWSFMTEIEPLDYPRRLAYEGFAYPQYLQLSQNNGGNGGLGWNTSWERSAGAWCYLNAGPGSLVPVMDYLLGTSGNKIQHPGAAANDGMRRLEYPVDARADQDYYISYLAMGDSSIYNSVTLGLFEAKNGASLFQSQMFYQGYPSVTTPQFALRDDQGNWTNKLFGSWASGEVYVIVVKISSHVSGNDTVSMSAFSQSNPLPVQEPAVWDKSFTTQSNKVYPWVYISGRSDQYDQWYVDEIHVGTGWGAVTGWASSCGDFGTIMAYDLNQDCTVGFEDYAVMAADWLKCTDPAIEGCEWVVAPNDPNYVGLFTALDGEELKVYEDDSVTVDGDLGEWDGSRWYNSRFTAGYNIANITDVTEVKLALKWDVSSPQFVYAAVKVTDTNHSFAAAPTLWNSGENIEIRFSANDESADTLWYDNSTFDTAQYYQLYPLSPSGAYANFGPIGTLRDAEVYTDFEYAVAVNGDEIVYEMAIPAYLAYNIGSQSGTTATLADGDMIAFNIQINSVNDALSGGLFNNQSHNPQDWAKFTVTANSSLVLGDMGFFSADLDKNGIVGLSDLDTIIDKWLSCTDPEVQGCDQPWLP